MCQGDIIHDVKVVFGFNSSGSEKNEFGEFECNFAVILNQECDLKWDFESYEAGADGNDDKKIDSILICPAFAHDELIKGVHIAERQMRKIDSQTQQKMLKDNQLPRYHYLEGDATFGVPDLVIDFKRFFTLPRETTYQEYPKIYLASINPLFREDLSNRFAYFLSRIGLPD